MTFARAQQIADAVLYEGYVLYPYRASARKNRLRWQFGVLAPREWSLAGGCEPWSLECTTLVEPEHGCAIEGLVRFLAPRARRIETAGEGDLGFAPVESLEVDGTLHTTWEEGVLREVPFAIRGAGTRDELFRFAAERSERALVAADGRIAGRVVETAQALSGRIRVSLDREDAPRPLLRLTLAVENDTPFAERSAPRDRALAAGLAGVHALLAVRAGAFVSLADPPDWAAAAAARCANRGVWPVLAGPEGDRSLLLASPIILSDHPAVAKESAGELCDATEIDEILALRVRTLTDAEKREARATDPRAAAIVARCDALSAADLALLHGVVRPAAPPAERTAAADLEAFFGAAEPPGDAVVEISGRAIGRGARVALRPTRRADAQDLFLAGRVGRVAGVFRDVDGGTHVGITLEDDPAAELHVWHGRFFYFAPDELVPMEEEE